ncbi:tyrosine--tRNA ligase [Blattabacterium cuenoti]|uniref:tyrosine--tRNA ligase n=1 Tax=Blattabacterium cuenoti TaxID=1653831 RepID=UPI00163B9359|nr:tyrosine--tRNA ligase [Blattabacterium cuenoti]
MKNIIDELSWRKLIQDKVYGIEEQLKKPTKTYIGFDPTSDSLHIGSLLPIIILIHLKRMGHPVCILIGGGTGIIGDPSERKDEKKILKEKILEKNFFSIRNQINKIFKYYSENVEILNNFQWIKNISFIDFIKNIGKHISINYLMSKNSIKKRVENGISFKEFSYALVQGYDFYYLNKINNYQLQIGGSDQWGNITTGIELIKKKTGKKVYGFTFPLITKSNGKKFGKSENEYNIWLDSKKTSPYKFYQFWMNLSDLESERYIKIYTFLSKKKISNLIIKHKKNPNKRLLQKKLAYNLTNWIHGNNKYQEIIKIISVLFQKDYKILQTLKKDECISIYKNIPNKLLYKNKLKKGFILIDLLKESGLFKSKKLAKIAIKSKSIYVNKILIKENFIIKEKNLIQEEYILLQFGKKNFLIVKFK